MSNLANYSPYNKTYKFILFQNQAYHQKNKRNISPCIKTNLRYGAERVALKNPQNVAESYSQSTRRCESPGSQMTRSLFFRPKKLEQSSMIDSPKRIIHKNKSFQKFRTQKVSQQNVDLVQRLMRSSCQVVKNRQSERSFSKHKKYEHIRRKYNQNGERKDSMPLGNQTYLCPTLKQFSESGLADKFVESDLSLSWKPSTARSIRRSHKAFD